MKEAHCSMKTISFWHFKMMTTAPPALLIYAGDRPDQHIRWVEPALVAEVSVARHDGWPVALPHLKCSPVSVCCLT